ncbi:response regulator [Desulfovibrio ferrophilus]|uniref:histidine kinase n=1 Tax=Desulfovibrio ferrophilus TaxID=241368 RepID=A0A2Z6B3K6_9BACT|nr:response regulator [Desulfovibrio ferrophilus]BBD10082.1 putative PAS/PAC sensor protein [Desulfovibrio ferrophilus]
MSTKLLLVDDEEGIRTFLGISLADLGYDVITAENGKEALKAFAEHQPPIVLTDIKMPVMDGIQLLKRIKKVSPDTEVIMISGHGDMDLAVKSLKFEAADFVTKPINDEVLEMALKRVREKISMRAELRSHTENLERLVEEKSARIVELERQAAVGQVVEGFAGAMRGLALDVEDGVNTFNEMPCFVSVHNAYMEIVAINQLYRERLGDMVGKNSWELYTEPEAQDAGCPVGRTFATGKGQRVRRMLATPDGSNVPVLVHTAPILDQEGEVDMVMEISVDVTEVARLQDELRTTRAKYQMLFDEAPCFISVQDQEFRITAANKLFKDHFGEPDEGSCCYKAYSRREAPCEKCPVAETFEDGQSHQMETVVTSKHGQQYNVLIWTAPIRDADGNVVEVMEMSTDITQLRELQDHLASLGLMIGSMSHGIKGMLTALDGGIYRVESGFKKNDSERIETGWETVKDLVNRIRSMVLQMLYYAKNRDLNWDGVDVASFFDGVAHLIHPKAQAAGVEFHSETRGDLGMFEADAAVISAALVNFLENAVDACGDDSCKAEHAVTFSVSGEKDHIVFTVADNGTGIAPEVREKMFTLFFSSKGCKGTGLGLFVSDKSIRQHGGTITVDSEAGKGSAFTVRLPRVLPDSAKTCREE